MMFSPGCECCGSLLSPNVCCDCGDTRSSRYYVSIPGTFTGVYGVGCPCEDIGIYTNSIFETAGPCHWLGGMEDNCVFISGLALNLTCDATNFILQVSATSSGVFATYTLARALWGCTGVNVMNYASSAECTGWPATAILTPF